MPDAPVVIPRRARCPASSANLGPGFDTLALALDLQVEVEIWPADRLSVRASSASRSLETLRQQQQADGYNLRADISSAQDRMQMYLAKGDAALKAKDLPKAQKYFDQADAELSKLEKFLGH